MRPISGRVRGHLDRPTTMRVRRLRSRPGSPCASGTRCAFGAHDARRSRAASVSLPASVSSTGSSREHTQLQRSMRGVAQDEADPGHAHSSREISLRPWGRGARRALRSATRSSSSGSAGSSLLSGRSRGHPRRRARPGRPARGPSSVPSSTDLHRLGEAADAAAPGPVLHAPTATRLHSSRRSPR